MEEEGSFGKEQRRVFEWALSTQVSQEQFSLVGCDDESNGSGIGLMIRSAQAVACALWEAGKSRPSGTSFSLYAICRMHLRTLTTAAQLANHDSQTGRSRQKSSPPEIRASCLLCAHATVPRTLGLTHTSLRRRLISVGPSLRLLVLAIVRTLFSTYFVSCQILMIWS